MLDNPAASHTTNTELFMQGIHSLAMEAREDISAFYGFVIREERTKVLLPPAAHQRLYFSFIHHHPRSVNRLPVGCGKTFGSSAYALWRIGNDVTQRGAIISKTQRQAMKPVGMVTDYITEPSLSKRVNIVFPHLGRTKRSNEKWTQKEITVHRPPGIRDASLMAAGSSTDILSARLSFIMVDDMISYENSHTPEARQDIRSHFDGTIMSRLDPIGWKVVVTNTPWNKEDQTFHLESMGWPTMTMDIYGYIKIVNADAGWLNMALQKFIRPSITRTGDDNPWYRLRDHDPDPEELKPLWPDRYPSNIIADIRSDRLPHEFARSFLCQPLSEEAGRCKKEWIERCKMKGIGKTLVPRYYGANATYTGFDLGIEPGRNNDLTVGVTLEKHPSGERQLLDIESKRIKGPEILDMVFDKHHRYKSAVRVEGNQGQKYIQQFAKASDRNIPVEAVSTTRANKHHKAFGIESIFKEFRDGLWIIPCDENGKCAPEVQALIDDMMYYDPAAHTPDRLMALWMAREALREGHSDDPKPRSGGPRVMPNSGGF